MTRDGRMDLNKITKGIRGIKKKQNIKTDVLGRQKQAGFTLIELMVALAIVGIISLFAAESMLQNQRGSRLNEFENEINAAMAELTRLTTDPITCYSTFHDLGPGNSDYAQEANKFTNWTKVPYFIYDSTKPEGSSNNLIARNFPTQQTLPNGDIIEVGTPPSFRGSKILGIRSVYLAPYNYPGYPLQETNVTAPYFRGNAFVVITFEYIGANNSMIGLKTRTKILPLSVTWAKKFTVAAAANQGAAGDLCTKLATNECATCVGSIITPCSSEDANGFVICPCAIFQPGRENWKIRECNSVTGG